jgi:hypothetical protein
LPSKEKYASAFFPPKVICLIFARCLSWCDEHNESDRENGRWGVTEKKKLSEKIITNG